MEITSSSGVTNVASKSVKVGKCGPSHSKTIANSGNKFNLLDIVENNGRFNFQMQSQSEVVSYQVSDISGRILIKKRLNCLINQNLSEEFELTSNGIYILTIRDGLKIINKKRLILDFKLLKKSINFVFKRALYVNKYKRFSRRSSLL